MAKQPRGPALHYRVLPKMIKLLETQHFYNLVEDTALTRSIRLGKNTGVIILRHEAQIIGVRARNVISFRKYRFDITFTPWELAMMLDDTFPPHFLTCWVHPGEDPSGVDDQIENDYLIKTQDFIPHIGTKEDHAHGKYGAGKLRGRRGGVPFVGYTTTKLPIPIISSNAEIHQPAHFEFS